MADFELLRIDNGFGLVPVLALVDGERTESAGDIAIFIFSMNRISFLEAVQFTHCTSHSSFAHNCFNVLKYIIYKAFVVFTIT